MQRENSYFTVDKKVKTTLEIQTEKLILHTVILLLQWFTDKTQAKFSVKCMA